MRSDHATRKKRKYQHGWLFALFVFCMIPFFTILFLIEQKWADGLFILLLLGSMLVTLVVGIAVILWWPFNMDVIGDEDEASVRDDS